MGQITTKGAVLAYKQLTGGTWGTPAAVGAEDQILATTGPPLGENREIHMSPEAGFAWHQYSQGGRKVLGFDLAIPLRYSGRMWSFIAQIFGLDTKTGAGDPYTHVISLIEAIDGSDLFGTLALQLGPASGELLHGWPAVKPYGFVLSGPNGQGFMDLSVSLICDKLREGADETTHTTAAFDNVTHMAISTALPPMVPFGALRLRMNAQTGDALAAGDNLKVKKFTYSFRRRVEQEWVNRQAYANEFETDEPIEDGIPEEMLSLEMGDIVSLTHFDAFQDQTEQKVEAYWALDASHDIKLELPRLKMLAPEALFQGQGRIPKTLKFQPMLASAAPTGMTVTNSTITLRDPNSSAYE
jgi:hypothetical protein